MNAVKFVLVLMCSCLRLCPCLCAVAFVSVLFGCNCVRACVRAFVSVRDRLCVCACVCVRGCVWLCLDL